jgi:hypothetical protein
VGARFGGLESHIPVLIGKTQTGTTSDFLKWVWNWNRALRFLQKKQNQMGMGIEDF